ISLQIPSIICYIASIHNILSNRNNLKALHNHGPLLLLFVGIITVMFDLSMILDFLRTGVVNPTIDGYCRIWIFFDMLLYAIVCVLMLWISIERYILIFHYRKFFDTQQKRLLIHYFPFIIIFVYLISFYIYGAFIYPCENKFDYHFVICGSLCFAFDNHILGLFDQFVNSLIPSLLIIFVNIGLWFRIFWQKHYRMRKVMEWRRHRKIIIQFIPVAILYMSGYLAYGSLQCYHMIYDPTNLSTIIQQLYFFYLFHLVGLLHPFICLIGMPAVYRKWLPKRDRHVSPAIINQTNSINR
ncbi:unnamed protein product, partial [Rotaria sp. Silwood2]